jgi:hypothetical protein
MAAVRGAGLGDAARVVVRKNSCAGIDAKRRPHDLTRVDACAVDGAGEQFLAIEDAMTVVEPENVKFLMGQRAQPHAQEVVGIGGVAHAALVFKLGSKNALSRGEHILFSRFAGEFVTSVCQRSREMHGELL